ncbi:S9 family peptidase [Corynebacterium liangguodongii]|uniref:Oligopeptidase B n=1 Tax=Corynebacterium liangguodongii TaxID=2079535 RepID=A0A2S0WFX1_9CORY|nr:S9 family peptidase [Corynebacterium liangguodongii]AWB84624.1 oligopeptidase B [Corynebacterium liangguodongii]PWB99632.1 S9 family peptidase [Corynebacterium liangguodongii]
MSTEAPKAEKHPITRSFHGREVVDNYEWLREKTNPATIAYLEAENAYTEANTAHLSELADTVYSEIKGRVKETDMSVPTRKGGWWYYGRTIEGKDYGVSCRVKAATEHPWTPPQLPEDGSPLPGESVLLDINELAAGHEFFSLGASSVSPSGKRLAYSFDTSGDERFELCVKDIESGMRFDDHLTDVFYGATWAGDDYIFYLRVDDAWRPHQVWRHKLGTAESEDVLVFEERDERFNVGVGTDRAERYLYIASSSKTTSEVRVLGLDEPEGEFRVLWEREAGVDYDVDLAVVGGEERWVVTHNAHGPNFSVGTCPVGQERPLRELDELVAHDDAVRVEGTDAYRDFLFAAYRRGGIGRLAVAGLTDGTIGEFSELAFDEELYTVGLGGNPEWDAPVVRVSYTSFTQPAQLFDYRVADGSLTLLKEQEVEGGYDPADYVATRAWATAEDGTKVPVSVVRRADADVDKPAPTLLYGYGSYEHSTDPYFSVARLSLLDRGMVWACAHVRGGGEMGRLWYDEGKMMRKRNTFTDFIACADALVKQGVTTYDQIVAEGGSAGGLLMGAVANLAPEKFSGILAVVPFVDQLTSILMPELPLTVTEWEEWGDPYHDPEAYDYIASYAPYENVSAQEYPAILAVTSLNDTRVLYVEPAKWIAKLREVATGGTFLLKTEMSAGHGGVSGRYAQWKQTAFEYAWVLATSGAVATK